MDTQALLEMSKGLLVTHGLNIVYSAVTLVIGLWIIKIITRITGKALDRTKVEVSLRKFLLALVSIVLKILLSVSVIAQLGVATTSFVAILGAAGLAVGLALQGSLANFAGGILILLFKPYKIGDFIDAQGISGKVKEIQVFNTVVTTTDNKTVIVPNGAMSNGIITNFSTQPMRRVDMLFGIGYDDDIDRAKELLGSLVTADTRILKDPAPQIAVSQLGDSSVNLVVRVWCMSGDYWEIFFAMHENVKKSFDQNGISIPFPQRDVHVYNH